MPHGAHDLLVSVCSLATSHLWDRNVNVKDGHNPGELLADVPEELHSRFGGRHGEPDKPGHLRDVRHGGTPLPEKK